MEQITGLPREPGPARYYQLHMQQGNVGEASFSLALSLSLSLSLAALYSHNLSFSQAITFRSFHTALSDGLSAQEGQQHGGGEEQIKTKRG